MTLQQWAFSFDGRIGRKPFWIGIAVCMAAILGLMFLQGLFQIAVTYIMIPIVVIFYPIAAIMTKRLHDRNKRGGWCALLLIAWILVSLDWSMAEPFWQWGLGRFLPLFITMMMVLDCGVFRGTEGANRFGETTATVDRIG